MNINDKDYLHPYNAEPNPNNRNLTEKEIQDEAYKRLMHHITITPMDHMVRRNIYDILDYRLGFNNPNISLRVIQRGIVNVRNQLTLDQRDVVDAYIPIFEDYYEKFITRIRLGF